MIGFRRIRTFLYTIFLSSIFQFSGQLGARGTEKAAGKSYAYNGGLFKPDTSLDALEIDNDLWQSTPNKLI